MEDPVAGMVPSPLFGEIHKGKAQNVARLLRGGAYVNQKDMLSWSPLHHAAFLGQAKIAELLVDHGADVDDQDRDGFTPLHLAAANSNVKAVAILLKAGANTTICDHMGRSPVQVSTEKTMTLFGGYPAAPANQASPAFQRRATTHESPHPSPLVSRRLNFDQVATPGQTYGIFTQINPVGGGPDTEPSSVEATPKEPESNWRKIWTKAKQVAKWQIMSIAVRILLVYLLEMFVDHLKRLLQVFVITYSPIDLFILLILQPLQYILAPIWPLLNPILAPVWNLFLALLTPLWNIILPLLTGLFNFIQPIFSFLYSTLLFFMDKISYFLEPLKKIFWEPLTKIFAVIASLFTPLFSQLWGVVQYIGSLISPFFGAIFRFFVALIQPLFTLLQRIVLALLQPFLIVFQKIGSALANFFMKNYQKIMQNIWNAIQPMLNLRGFFARVFGPLITGLKAILHWFLPDRVLARLDKIAMMIFDRDNLQTATNTEETALIVIFVFVAVVYGGVVMWGYISKLVIAVIYLFNSDIANRLFDLFSVFSDEEENVDITINWLLPDFWHHQIGIFGLLAFVTIVLAYRLVLTIAFVSVWLWHRKHMALFWKYMRFRNRSSSSTSGSEVSSVASSSSSLTLSSSRSESLSRDLVEEDPMDATNFINQQAPAVMLDATLHRSAFRPTTSTNAMARVQQDPATSSGVSPSFGMTLRTRRAGRFARFG